MILYFVTYKNKESCYWPQNVRIVNLLFQNNGNNVFPVKRAIQCRTCHVLTKSFCGLCTRLVSKIFSHSLCYALQASLGKTNEFRKIKHLIFQKFITIIFRGVFFYYFFVK